MQTQKIIKVGNSLAVTIPADFAKKENFKAGEEVAVEADHVSDTMLIKPKRKATETSLTPEFHQWVKHFIKEYKPVLDQLAHL